MFEAVEGDSKYLAPEVLSGSFSKKADIFSLGITLLELACDLDLPANGTLWHELRQGSLPSTITKREFTHFTMTLTDSHFTYQFNSPWPIFWFPFFFFYIDLSRELQSILESMMSPNPEVRPSARLLLDHPFLRSRRRLRCLRLGLRNTQQWLFTSAIRIFSYLLQLFLMLFFPIRALARKWRKSNYNQPATPVRSLPDKNCGKCINDFSFSDGNFSIHFIFNFQIVI